jgi:hypothetical protein
MDSLASQIIVDIIATRMDLDPQTVWVRNQNRKIPQGDGIYIAVGQIGWKVYGNNREEVSTEIPQPSPTPAIQTLTEVITISAQEMIQIDIMSRNNDALMRQWEIIAALNSTYAEQKQEANSFRIATIPQGFIDSSFAEGGSMLNRFTITIACNVWYKSEQILSQGDIYDSFETRVDDALSIETDEGIIEFTIDENTVIEEAT